MERDTKIVWRGKLVLSIYQSIFVTSIVFNLVYIVQSFNKYCFCIGKYDFVVLPPLDPIVNKI